MLYQNAFLWRGFSFFLPRHPQAASGLLALCFSWSNNQYYEMICSFPLLDRTLPIKTLLMLNHCGPTLLLNNVFVLEQMWSARCVCAQRPLCKLTGWILLNTYTADVTLQYLQGAHFVGATEYLSEGTSGGKHPRSGHLSRGLNVISRWSLGLKAEVSVGLVGKSMNCAECIGFVFSISCGDSVWHWWKACSKWSGTLLQKARPPAVHVSFYNNNSSAFLQDIHEYMSLNMSHVKCPIITPVFLHLFILFIWHCCQWFSTVF